ncbi:hypothetical protein BH23BAC1_BH23BAC1_17690 [soil metagenome]
MAVIKKTPGVYVEEISFFPPAIAAVDTAVPAFIGYTDHENDRLQAVKISSLLEFEERYCDWDNWKLTFTVNENTIDEDFSRNELYYHMQLYFANGGGKCYVISLGKKAKNSTGKREDYLAALNVLANEDEPTLIVMPEASQLAFQSCMDVYQAALAQAANLMDRFVILDVPQGNDEIAAFRNGIGINNLRFGAAYYPYLNTSISKYSLVSDEDIIFKNVTVEDKDGKKTKSLTNSNIEHGNMDRQNMVRFIKSQTLTMPPSAAIAGVYASVDSSRGVWKAPANVSLKFVSSLFRKISHDDQAELNVHPEGGKSINAIRSFTGQGVMVWGARTLAGNDNEWRYVNVRRFYNFVEESVKKATQQFVFEANDANTWVRVSTMIENFLTNLWRQGALAGATPNEAFFVKVGLGVTMTFDDILNGLMNVEIGLAVIRPAEFIILKFSQKIQES